MKKIIFVDVPMQKKNTINYCNTGNVKSKYDKEIVYPINAWLAERVVVGDELKIVLIETINNDEEHDRQTKENSELYLKEIEDAVAGKNVQIEVVHLKSDFDESKENQELRFRKMIDVLETDCELLGDITFGPRLLSMLLFCVFNFGERFYNCRIKGIIYGKALHNINDSQKVSNGALYDVSTLYHLNNLTNSIQVDTAKDALRAFDEFFSL